MHLPTSSGRSRLLPSEPQKSYSMTPRIQRFRSRSNWKGIATAGCDNQTTSVRESKLSTPKGRPHSRANKCSECWAPEERRSESHQNGIPQIRSPINVVDGYESVKRSVGGAISVTRSRSSFLLESGASVISRG